MRNTVLILLMLGFNLSLMAKEAGMEQDIFSMSLEQLLSIKITTASKSPQKASTAPSVVSIFTRQDIEMMGGNSLIDIIKYAPGIETSMSPNGNWRVSIRGIRKDGIILLLVDGHPFNDFYDGQAQFDLPLSIIQKVEIIRGPGSALYGTNAVAGVINVFTNGEQSYLRAAVGNNDSYQANFSLFHEFESAKLSMNVGSQSTDGANVTEGDDFVNSANANANFPTRTNRFVEEYYLSAKYNQGDLDLSFFGLDKKRGPWVGPSLIFGPKTVINKSQYFLKGRYAYQAGEKITIVPNFYFETTHFDSLNQDIVSGRVLHNNLFTNGGFTKDSYQTSNFGQELSVDYQFSDQVKFLFGVSHDNLKLTDYDLSRDYQVIGFVPQQGFANYDQLVFEQKNQSREVIALYMQSEINWEKVFLTLGVRYDDYSDFGSSMNPRLAFIFKPTERWTGKLLFGSAFRAPTFRELYDNTRIGVRGFSGNTELKPEENQTLEFSFEYQNDSYVLRANLFDLESENVIDLFDPNGSGQRGSIENLGTLSTTGFELEGVFQLSESFRLFANYSSYRMAFNWRDDPTFSPFRQYIVEQGDNQLFNQPRTRANAGASWKRPNWTVFISANYGGRASHNNTTPLEGLRELLVDEYLQFNLNWQYIISSKMTIGFFVNNLGESKNSDPVASSDSDILGLDGLLQPEENFQVNFRYKF